MQHVVNIVGLLSILMGAVIVATPQNAPRQVTGQLAWSDPSMTSSPAAPRSQRPATAELGRKALRQHGCVQCHSVEGRRLIGPPLNDLAGRTVTFSTGRIREADDVYLRESIEEPSRHLVDGFNAAMPSYRGRLKEREIESVLLYLRSISRHSAPR